MTRFNAQTIAQWTDLATAWLAPHNLTPAAILTGRDAWTVAARCGINDHAYSDRTVTDGHIQTALQSVFPNAVFEDRKVY